MRARQSAFLSSLRKAMFSKAKQVLVFFNTDFCALGRLTLRGLTHVLTNTRTVRTKNILLTYVGWKNGKSLCVAMCMFWLRGMESTFPVLEDARPLGDVRVCCQTVMAKQCGYDLKQVFSFTPTHSNVHKPTIHINNPPPCKIYKYKYKYGKKRVGEVM